MHKGVDDEGGNPNNLDAASILINWKFR